jgi:two-component system, cell cycle response regulator DivK
MRTVLVVDDSLPNRELLRNILEHCGYNVVEATNGAEAVDSARTHAPSLILMDLQMPVLDGFQAMLLIRGFASREQIPAIAVSAYAMIEDEEKAYAAGFNAYVTKPLQLANFRQQVAKFLEEKELAAGA